MKISQTLRIINYVTLSRILTFRCYQLVLIENSKKSDKRACEHFIVIHNNNSIDIPR